MVTNVRIGLRRIEWATAQVLGFLLVCSLRVLRHHSEILPVHTQTHSIRLFFSDANGQGFKDWTSLYYRVASSSIDFLAESGVIHECRANFAKAICVVRGLRKPSFLLGNTFVFFVPNTNDEAIIRISFMNDLLWLLKRNKCYYQDRLPLKECISEATRYSGMSLRNSDLFSQMADTSIHAKR